MDRGPHARFSSRLRARGMVPQRGGRADGVREGDGVIAACWPTAKSTGESTNRTARKKRAGVTGEERIRCAKSRDVLCEIGLSLAHTHTSRTRDCLPFPFFSRYR